MTRSLLLSSKIFLLTLCLPLMGFSILSDFNSKFVNSSRIVVSSENLVGATLLIDEKSIVISREDLLELDGSDLNVLILRVSEGMHVVTLSRSNQVFFRTMVILNIGQTRELRVRS